MKLNHYLASVMFFAALVFAPMQAKASSDLFKFCNDQELQTIQRSAAVVTTSIGVTKAVFSAIFSAETVRWSLKNNAATTLKTFKYLEKPLGFLLPPTRSFFKALIPSLTFIHNVLGLPDPVFKSELSRVMEGSMLAAASTIAGSTTSITPLAKFATGVLRVYRVWDVTAPLIYVYVATAESMCAIVKDLNPHCQKGAKDKSKCALPVYNDLPDGREMPALQSTERRSCDNNAAIAEYIQLLGQLAPVARQLRSTNKSILGFLKPLASALSQAKSALSPMKGPMSALSSGLNVTNLAMKPIAYASKQLDNAMNQQICAKFKVKIGKIQKQTKKCTRIKNLAKDLNKYTQEAQKALKLATKKIIDPILNKVINKVAKLPGLNAFTQVAKKIGSTMAFNKTMEKTLDAIKKLPMVSVGVKVKSAITKLQAIKAKIR